MTTESKVPSEGTLSRYDRLTVLKKLFHNKCSTPGPLFTPPNPSSLPLSVSFFIRVFLLFRSLSPLHYYSRLCANILSCLIKCHRLRPKTPTCRVSNLLHQLTSLYTPSLSRGHSEYIYYLCVMAFLLNGGLSLSILLSPSFPSPSLSLSLSLSPSICISLFSSDLPHYLSHFQSFYLNSLFLLSPPHSLSHSQSFYLHLSLPLSPSHSLSLSILLSPSLSFPTLSVTLNHSISISFFPSLFSTLSISHSQSFYLSISLFLPTLLPLHSLNPSIYISLFPLSPSYSLSHSQSFYLHFSLSLSPSPTLSLFLSILLSPSLSFSCLSSPSLSLTPSHSIPLLTVCVRLHHRN
ncbi:unnamed protein product [Acanthosepion pharaonis]|uniref:Uncharacterized protein n=1 Tax=Acanthosepion pharaonis TaxID=158019 RepID=A0A812C7H0_ACAPH|nr:unnamed protein product [Sepia pharaonis]